MKQIRIAICDNDPNDRLLFDNRCKKWGEVNNIRVETIIYENNFVLLSDTKSKTFDILLLEYDENEEDGVLVAQKMRSVGYVGQIIFLANNKSNNSIHNRKVEEIFEAQGAEYFLKINSLRRFESVLKKVVGLVRESTTEYVQYGRIGEYRQIAVHDIRYFDVRKNLVCVHYDNDKNFEFLSTLDKVSNQLCDRGFFRIHRCFLISLEHIRRLTFKEVEMSCGTIIPVGRSNYALCKEAFIKYRNFLEE